MPVVLSTVTNYAETCPQAFRMLQSAGHRLVQNPFQRPMTRDEILAAAADCAAMILGTEVVDRALLDGLPNLRIIARFGVGLDNIDIEYAKSKGVVVKNVARVNARSVAELALTLIFSLARNVTHLHEELRRGNWIRPVGTVLEGKTLGILGLGQIGKEVGRLARCLGMKVVAYDIATDEQYCRTYGVETMALDDVVRDADFLSVHVPAIPETFRIINEERLRMMKPGAYLINTSRGSTVDERALVRALREQWISGAALDVFEREPLAHDHPLLRMKNVIVTPHVGGETKESITRTAQLTAEMVLDALGQAQEK